MKRVVTFLAIFGLISSSLALPFIIEAEPHVDPDYRLNRDVLPSNYAIKLILNADFGTNPQFDGEVAITMQAQKAEVNKIVLHSNVESITSVTLSGFISITNHVIDKTTDKLTITLASALNPIITYTLTIKYKGVLKDNMKGFYRSSFINEAGDKEWLATTQFQPTHAREAFPCFDEPSFKATFDITIERPETYKTLANTKLQSSSNPVNGKVADTFQTTPKMSSYLIAFIISKFESVPTTNTDFKVWTRSEALATGTYANTIGPDILEKMGAWAGSPYEDQKLGKLDMVAIPDFSAGAMENWGLITYRETALLWDETESSNRYKQRVATVISHEIAHNWFGNLVTTHWWSDTWLNEGFARYFEYHITAQVEDTWELEQQFVIEQVHSAFGVDALSSSKAMSTELNSPSEIMAHFSTISYNKGGSVIRMMEHAMGSKNFKAGLQEYLKNQASGNGTRDALWNTLTQHNNEGDFNLKKVMEGWATQPGYPVLTLAMDGSDAVITQQRFLITGPNATSEVTWDVPINYITSHELGRFDSTAPTHWLLSKQEELRIPFILHGGEGWIILNCNETGYYRVNYDDDQWLKLYEGLSATKDSINVLNRAQIVDDVLNLARAGYTSYSNALKVTSYLQKETAYYPWYAAFQAFSFLLLRLGSDGVGDKMTVHVKSLMTNLLQNTEFDIKDDDSQVVIHKKVLTYTWACQLNIDDCVAESKAMYAEFMAAPTTKKVSPNLRPIVYCTAIREGGAAEWNFLWDQFGKTKLSTEQILILNALGCSKNVAILNEYLTKSITPTSGIRTQDASSVFTSVYTNNPEGIEVAFDFLQEKYQEIAANYAGMNALGGIISGLSSRLTTKEQIDKMETFINTNGPQLGDAAAVGKSAIESARANLAWTDKYKSEINSYFTSSGKSIIVSGILTASLLFITRLL